MKLKAGLLGLDLCGCRCGILPNKRYPKSPSNFSFCLAVRRIETGGATHVSFNVLIDYSTKFLDEI